jgi:predicted transglutaminase-like cysteine proteinase
MIRTLLTYLIFGASALLNSDSAIASNFTIFDSTSYIRTTHKALPQWQSVLKQWDQELDRLNECERDFSQCQSNLQIGFNAFLSRLSVLSNYEKLAEANRYANEQSASSETNPWRSPLSFLENGGSGEDRVILKYFLLRKAGIEAQNLRLLLAEDPLRGSRQLMLVAKDDEGIKILSDQGSAVLRQDDLAFYVPIISWNENARWLHIPRPFVSKGAQ